MGEAADLPVLRSVEKVVAGMKRVFLHPGRTGAAVAGWAHLLPGFGGWSHPCHFFDGTEETLRWIFTLDLLNHCFWPNQGEPVWTVFYKDTGFSGYWALAAALKRATEDGIPVTSAEYLSAIPEAEFSRIFSGQGEIPLLSARLKNLREAGRVLLERYGGDAANLVRGAGGSAVRLVLEVVSAFPSFRDEAEYGGSPVYFWKRAQLFAADVHGAFGGQGMGRLGGIGELSAFADYKLPQVLRELGIISYCEELSRRIDAMEPIQPASPEEVEIRAATVHAVELLKDAFARAGVRVTSTQVDNWLWQLGQLEPFRKRPYHRCRTIFY